MSADAFTALVAFALLLASIAGLAGVIGGIIELGHSREDLAELQPSRR